MSIDAGPTFLTSWATLAAELGIEAEAAQDIGLDLAACHTEPHRHYHTMRHIEAVLDHLEDLGSATPTARLAAFFHDAIYDPTRHDNEAQSAELAVEVLRAVELDLADDVAKIIMATAGHQLPDDAPRETAAFLDADLSILAAPRDIYDEYAQNVRSEYSHMPDDDFRAGRKVVLEMFLGRSQLYFTSAGQVRFEVAARANLTRELSQTPS